MRKARSDATLFKLPAAQRHELTSWLLDENLSYAGAAARIQERFGVETHPSSVGVFYGRVCAPKKLATAATAAAAVQELAGGLAVDWSTATASLLGQRIFEVMASPEADPGVIVQLGGILEKIRSRELREKEVAAASEKLKLARDQFEFSAAAAVLKHAAAVRSISGERALSDDEKRERLRRLLFPQAFEAEEAAAVAS